VSSSLPVQELLPEFRPVMSAYYDALTALGMRVMRLLALTLNLPAGFFTDRFQQPLASLRPIHYSGRVSQPDDVRTFTMPVSSSLATSQDVDFRSHLPAFRCVNSMGPRAIMCCPASTCTVAIATQAERCGIWTDQRLTTAAGRLWVRGTLRLWSDNAPRPRRYGCEPSLWCAACLH